MNVITALIERIEARRTETAKPCNSYATQAAAEKKAAELAQQAGQYFGFENRPMRYIVVFNEAWGRWVVGFDMTETLQRQGCQGGYLGLLSDKGFYTY